MTVGIKVNNVAGVAQLVNWASKQPFEVYITSNDGNLSINLKSFLNSTTIIGKDVNLTIPDHASIDDVLKALQQI